MKYLRYLLHLGIGLIILVVLFTKIPFSNIASIISTSDLRLFFFAFLVGVLILFVNAFRWQVLLRYLGYKYDLMPVLNTTFMGFFFNIYLPGGIVGDITRVAILPGTGNPKNGENDRLSKVAASVVADKFAGLIGLMLLAVIGIFFIYKLLLTAILAVFAVAVAVMIIMFFALFSRRFQTFLKKILAMPLKVLSPVKGAVKEVTGALLVYRDHYSVFGKVIPISIFSNLLIVCYYFLLARSINVDIGFLKLLAFVPVIEFVSALPISIGGVGVREVMTILLFSSCGVTAARAMSVSLLTFAVLLLLGAIGGVLLLYRYFQTFKKKLL